MVNSRLQKKATERPDNNQPLWDERFSIIDTGTYITAKLIFRQ
jgi:hypothetical protein